VLSLSTSTIVELMMKARDFMASLKMIASHKERELSHDPVLLDGIQIILEKLNFFNFGDAELTIQHCESIEYLLFECHRKREISVDEGGTTTIWQRGSGPYGSADHPALTQIKEHIDRTRERLFPRTSSDSRDKISMRVYKFLGTRTHSNHNELDDPSDNPSCSTTPYGTFKLS